MTRARSPSQIGCGLKDPYVGSGPITLNSDVEADFASYQALDFPSYFAVSLDGQTYGYSYCDGGNCAGNGQTIAIESCEQTSEGVPCKLYAKGRNVVWDDADETTTRVQPAAGPPQ